MTLNPISMPIFKVVKATNEGRMVSCNGGIRPKFVVTYNFNELVRPVVGKLFCFSNPINAAQFARVQGGFVVEGKGFGNVKPTNILSFSDSSDEATLVSFWTALKNKQQPGGLSMYAVPHMTVYSSSVKLDKVIFAPDESSMRPAGRKFLDSIKFERTDANGDYYSFVDVYNAKGYAKNATGW